MTQHIQFRNISNAENTDSPFEMINTFMTESEAMN